MYQSRPRKGATLKTIGMKVVFLHQSYLGASLWGIVLPFLDKPVDGDPGPIADVHQIAGNLLLGIALLHAAFALWHFFRLLDQTL
jgi:cytochrome b561